MYGTLLMCYIHACMQFCGVIRILGKVGFGSGSGIRSGSTTLQKMVFRGKFTPTSAAGASASTAGAASPPSSAGGAASASSAGASASSSAGASPSSSPSSCPCTQGWKRPGFFKKKPAQWFFWFFLFFFDFLGFLGFFGFFIYLPRRKSF
jgi:hypothetical protein